MIDIATGWLECSALLGKSEIGVKRAFTQKQSILPFALLGLDTDNGSKFLNYVIFDWCTEQEITFTRAREYRKNDQAHVEEKNGSVVRRLIGYDRFEGGHSWRLLSMPYEVARLYINFFQPSLKLSHKERDGGSVKRLYEPAATAYQRILGSSNVSTIKKDELTALFNTLDPLRLLEELERLQQQLWNTSVPVKESKPAPYHQLLKSINDSEPVKPQIVAAKAKTSNQKLKTDWLPTVAYPGKKKGKKTTLDEVWEEVCIELNSAPLLTPRNILALLEERYPGKFRTSQLSTITDKLRNWRFTNNLPIEFDKLKPGKKSNVDEIWELALLELEEHPDISLRALLNTLVAKHPNKVNLGQRTSLYERHRVWRAGRTELVNTFETNLF
jgi:hypothetical protein